MGLSLLQSVKVGAYVMKHRIKGTKKYPLVLMLEPLFRCNLVVRESWTPSGQERPVAKNRAPALLSDPGGRFRFSHHDPHRAMAPDCGRGNLVPVPGGDLRRLAWSATRPTSPEPLARRGGDSLGEYPLLAVLSVKRTRGLAARPGS